MYTIATYGNKRGSQGWTVEGRNRFAAICCLVREDRVSGGNSVDKEMFTWIVRKYSKTLTSTPKKARREEEEEEDFFDELQFLSPTGVYSPVQMRKIQETDEGGEREGDRADEEMELEGIVRI